MDADQAGKIASENFSKVNKNKASCILFNLIFDIYFFIYKL